MSRTREKARALLGAGVEVVRGDFDDRASLQAAIDGVERVFLLTGQMGGRPPDATVCALAAQAGVRHIVRLSVLEAGGGANDPMTRWPTAPQNATKASRLPSTLPRPRGFMS